MLNTSILYPTIVGSKICRTYEPPAKTEMRADPVAWPAVSLTQCSLEIMMGVIISTNVQFQLTISLNSSEIITYVIYIHDKTMTTADYGGKLPKYIQDDLNNNCCLVGRLSLLCFVVSKSSSQWVLPPSGPS